MTLQTLFDEDKERLIASLSGADKAAVIKEVQNELDRVLFAFNNQEDNASIREAANAMVQTAKAAASLADTAGVTRIYGRTEYGVSASAGNGSDVPTKGKLPKKFWILLALGIVAALPYFYVVYQLVSNLGSEAVWTVFFATPPAAMLLLFLAGLVMRREEFKKEEKLHAETLTDPMKVWHNLRGVILVIDKQLEEMRTFAVVQEKRELARAAENADTASVELMAQLLEDAYGMRSAFKDTEAAEQAGEMISRIRYFLHMRHIETLDYQEEQAAGDRDSRSWFDMIPAYESGTLRPALVSEGKLLKKGLASAGHRE